MHHSIEVIAHEVLAVGEMVVDHASSLLGAHDV